MLISPEQEALIGQVFETYLREHHQGDILQLIADASEETHHAVVVNAMTLFEANMELGDYFNAYPNNVLAIFDKVLLKTATELSPNAKHYSGQRIKPPRMRHIPHTRITGLPVCPELTRDTIPRSRDVGHFLSVTGTVIRTSVTKVLEYERDYMCTKCRHVFTVEADFEQFYTFDQLVACPNPDGCNSYKFTCLSEGSEPAACKDYQEIKIQEQVQRLMVGSIPRSMVVVLEDDLVDSCKSGDDVTVYGVMCQRWKPFYDGTRCDVELVLKANNIEVNNQQAAAALVMMDVQKEFEDFWNNYKHDPIAGRNQILLSLCPQVFGMYLIKLAVAMVLAGGVQRIDSSGTKIRGECHMLLVGDPGTGKSQFLKYAAKIMPRSVLTAGIGSTSAGLTVAAVKDGGDWHLEAGALVLSDGGLCCIDEFNSIKEHDRISIHEAMEQQSISVAKAGMVCKLNTRTTILAATNPKGQYNPNEPLSVNVALASPLLSRFDLVLVLMDTRNTEWDRVISSFILEDRGLSAESSSLWSMEKMKAYFSMIKRLQPQVSDEANKILTRYYQLQRQSDSRNTARTTIRMLESLSRLAEAHARLMYRETVTIEDAVMAVSVMECSMQGGALLGNVNALLTSFPADPSQQYKTQCQILLEGLDLPLLLQKEMDRLARLKRDMSEAYTPAGNHRHQHRETSSINKTHGDDITRDNKRDGLDWFHCITPSLMPHGIASPIITSTQENSNRKSSSTWSEMSTVTKQSNCQTEKDICNIGSALDYNLISSSLVSFNSASEERRQDGEKNEKYAEKTSITQGQMKQLEEEKDRTHSERMECVLEKVSKNLRDRRLRELKLSHQRCDKAEGGRLGESVVSRDGAGENVTILDTTSESKTSRTLSSDKNSSTNTQINLCPGKEGGFVKEDKKVEIGTKHSRLVQMEKTAAEAETNEELFSKLSSFIYKPRKIKPPVLNHGLNASSDVSTEFETERNSDTESQMSKQKPVSHDDSVGLRTGTEKKKRQNQYQVLSEGRSRRKQASSASGRSEAKISFTSEELGKDVFSFGQEEMAQEMTGGSIKARYDAENRCQQQRSRVTIDDEIQVDSFDCSLPPRTFIKDPATSKSDLTKSTVTSSTLGKLSTFSFTCKTEHTTTAQTKVEQNPLIVNDRSPHKTDCAERLNDRSKKTPNSPKHSPKKTKTVLTMSSLNDILPPTNTELTGQKPEEGTRSSTKTLSQTVTVSKFKGKQTLNQSHSVKMVNDDPLHEENTVNVRKRKCFQLGPPLSTVGGSKGLFSELSLFGSVDLSNDVLDTDWDQEVSKKAKI